MTVANSISSSLSLSLTHTHTHTHTHTIIVGTLHATATHISACVCVQTEEISVVTGGLRADRQKSSKYIDGRENQREIVCVVLLV